MTPTPDRPPVFARTRHPVPVADAERARLIADPVFGRVFTDHMVSIRFADGAWRDAEVLPRGPLSLDPATAVLHYAQEIFEGLKAYPHAGGGMALFRPDANARRFAASARRMAMPALPEAAFIAACEEMVRADARWMPAIDGGALYLRPFMIATEVFLGVRPAAEYRVLVIASPVGRYFKGGERAISLWVAGDASRAAPGGTGAAKCGGNYAASLAAQADAIARGHDQVVFLDAMEHRFVEELGGMNLMFVMADGTLVTPPLTGTILPGITRDSILTLARAEGRAVEERPYAIGEWRDDAVSGRLVETMACGTAAVVTSIGRVAGEGMEFTIGDGGPGPVAGAIRATLTGIQRGALPDDHGWVHPVRMA